MMYIETSKQIALTKNLINDQIQKAKAKNFKKFLEGLPPNSLAFKKIYSYLKIKPNTFCAELNNTNTTLYDHAEIAKCFHSHFQTVYEEKVPNHTTVHTVNSSLSEKLTNIPNSITQFNSVQNSFDGFKIHQSFISYNFLESTVKSLNTKKSAGPDEISNFI